MPVSVGVAHKRAAPRQLPQVPRRKCDIAPSIDADLLAALPRLRAYAHFLAHHRADAEDLLHDGIVRMLAAAGSYTPGTNFAAWACTVMRNRFLNIVERRKGRFINIDDVEASAVHVADTQTQGLEHRDLANQFMRLPAESRTVLSLAAGKDMSYAQIAMRTGCAVGTVKSRVHRARAALQGELRKAYADCA